LINCLLAALWIFSGLCFLRSPAESARHLGYEGLGPQALVDVRASIGGVCLAAGLGALALAAFGRLEAALWLQAVLLGGYAGGRAIGLFLLKGEPRRHRRWLLVEIGLLLVVISAIISGGPP
jgi:hypothetical protein